jgi:putative hydrolase
MGPSRALRQIAFQLERAGVPTDRVQAVHRAAAVLAALPAGELARRNADATLEDLRGIGPAIATAIAQAVLPGWTDFRASATVPPRAV